MLLILYLLFLLASMLWYFRRCFVFKCRIQMSFLGSLVKGVFTPAALPTEHESFSSRSTRLLVDIWRVRSTVDKRLPLRRSHQLTFTTSGHARATLRNTPNCLWLLRHRHESCQHGTWRRVCSTHIEPTCGKEQRSYIVSEREYDISICTSRQCPGDGGCVGC